MEEPKSFCERLRQWRTDWEYNEHHAASQIRRTRLDMTVERYRQLERGAEPTEEERRILLMFI